MTETHTVTTAEIVLAEVLAERYSQVNKHGYDHTHDDAHDWGELGVAAVVYVDAAFRNTKGKPWYTDKQLDKHWPWDSRFTREAEPRANLIKAAALIVAEIERLDRVQS